MIFVFSVNLTYRICSARKARPPSPPTLIDTRGHDAKPGKREEMRGEKERREAKKERREDRETKEKRSEEKRKGEKKRE